MTAPHQTVPTEPTEEMLASFNGLWRTRVTKTTASRIYKMMLSAAPPPPEDQSFTVTHEMIAAGNRAGGPMADNVDGVYRAMRALAPDDRLLAEAVKALELIEAQCDLPLGARRSARLDAIDAIADRALSHLRAARIGEGGQQLEEAAKAAEEALKRVVHTLAVHGKIDADTPLHEFVDDTLTRLRAAQQPTEGE